MAYSGLVMKLFPGLSLPLIAVLVLTACGDGGNKTPDAGIDDSCGIDCAAQNDYGLILGRCFEYTETSTAVTPPNLGVSVEEVVTLENGVKGLSVKYRTGGLTKMEDVFAIKNGELYLLRRNWLSAQSVTYKDNDNNVVGTLWLRPGTAPGENVSSGTVKADFINGAARVSEDSKFSLLASAATATDLKTPAEQFTEGLRLLITETPLHGADTRRTFVKGKGFVRFTSTLTIAGGQSQEFTLQKIRDVPAGAFDCGS